MPHEFTARELLDLARKIESDGAAFYDSAAQRAEDPSVAQFLGQLAAMERDHEQVFTALGENWSHESADVAQDQPVVNDYLNLLAQTRFFPPEGAGGAWSGQETLSDALAKAIELENDSILFYVALKEMVPTEEGRGQVDEIIHQEMAHATGLRNLMEEVIRE